MNRGNYRGLKLIEQVMKVLECGVEGLIRQRVEIDEMRVPRDVIWWVMRKLGIDEWLVRLVQSMYKVVRSRVREGDGYSEGA